MPAEFRAPSVRHGPVNSDPPPRHPSSIGAQKRIPSAGHELENWVQRKSFDAGGGGRTDQSATAVAPRAVHINGEYRPPPPAVPVGQGPASRNHSPAETSSINISLSSSGSHHERHEHDPASPYHTQNYAPQYLHDEPSKALFNAPPVTAALSQLSATILSLEISASSIRFCFLCMLWYSSSALTNTTGKQILNQFKYPVTLTYVQFGFVAALCIAASAANVVPNRVRRPSWAIISVVWPMAGFQIAGHVFSSFAIVRVPVSFAHTIKALSPLFTVVLYRLYYGLNYAPKVYLSLLPLTFGVMLVCLSELKFNTVGFVCALISTLIFVIQNMFTKNLFVASSDSNSSASASHSPSPASSLSTSASDQPISLDKMNLLFYSSGLAFLGMGPLWAYSDARALFSFDPSDTQLHQLVILFLLNGLSHFFQNVLAFHLLSLVSPVTYSVASLIKRIVVICASIVWFGQAVDARQGFGIAMTFFGLWVYQGAKRDVETKKPGAGRKRRKSFLLPM
ncbi:suppressor of loss of ypt1 [Geranomyces variabilis]|uniref:Suppressor of loss of ypt1 n=1 Tax=Geranomyces variabilis TaxID=109894 RepID=A0AAD5TGB5_9FUNG|nr:suppressor of loss of ypt1 [Geranomyces variabilis]